MRTSAGRIAVTALASLACLCVAVACGGVLPTTPSPEVISVSEPTISPPIQVTVRAAETANAAVFTAQTAAAQAITLTALSAPIRVTLQPIAPTLASAPSTPSAPPTRIPVAPTPGPASSAYAVAYPLIGADDLTQRPDHYENMRFSVIGYAYNVHARKGTTTFFLASDEQRSNSIFVSLDGADSRLQENAQIQVYGTGAKTIRVVTNGNEERESPFMRAVVIRPTR